MRKKNFQKKISKLMALLLVLTLGMGSLAACGNASDDESSSNQSENAQEDSQNESSESSESSETAESGYPEYLNVDSAYPIIKDEYAGTIKIKMAIPQSSISGEWDDLWVTKYFKEKYNVEFETEAIPEASISDRKNLMMQSGELPDIMFNMNFTTAELYKYGQQEGLLLQMDQYMNETLTPDILRYFESDPQIQNNSTAPDGHVYTMPWIYSSQDEGIYQKIFINKAWLEELGLEMPKTLDEFTDAMYKIKEADLAGVGSENVYPISGGMNDNIYYLLNAFGYMTTDGYGASPALREGEVVIPAYDMDVYQEFLELMNQYYNDGIINPNFVVIEETEMLAQVAGGQNAVYDTPVYVAGVEKWDEWYACYPLTSDWQTEAEWPIPNYVNIGNFVISADTEYPELCMRIANTYFNNKTDVNRNLWMGVSSESEYSFDYATTRYFTPEELGEEYGNIGWDDSLLPDGMDSWTYLMSYIAGFMPAVGTIELPESVSAWSEAYEGAGPVDTDTTKRWDREGFDPASITDGDAHYRWTTWTNVMPYAVQSYPAVYYLDEETQVQLDDLYTVINPYIKEQVALFITGGRPLSEVDAFKQELKDMGIEDMLAIYQQIYDDYMGN